IVRFPVTVAVPVETVNAISSLEADGSVIVSEAQEKDPAPTAIVIPLELSVRSPMDTPFVTVNELVPEMVTPPGEFVAPIVILLQAATTFTVTVTPLFITTSLPDVGTEAPPQVTVLFQLPLTDAVLVCALTMDAVSIVPIRMVKIFKAGRNCFIMLGGFVLL